MNTVEKYCTHCKKAGHGRKECWTLHGCSEKIQERQQKPINNKKITTALVKRRKKRNDSDSSFSSSEEEEEVSRIKTSRPAREYKVTQTHENSRANTTLDLVTLPIQEAKREKNQLLVGYRSDSNLN